MLAISCNVFTAVFNDSMPPTPSPKDPQEIKAQLIWRGHHRNGREAGDILARSAGFHATLSNNTIYQHLWDFIWFHMLNQSGPELEVALHYCHTRVATTTNLVAGGQRGMLQNGLRNNLEFSRGLVCSGPCRPHSLLLILHSLVLHVLACQHHPFWSVMGWAQ